MVSVCLTVVVDSLLLASTAHIADSDRVLSTLVCVLYAAKEAQSRVSTWDVPFI